MLKQRIITGLIAGVLLALALYYLHSWMLGALFFSAMIACSSEFYYLMRGVAEKQLPHSTLEAQVNAKTFSSTGSLVCFMASVLLSGTGAFLYGIQGFAFGCFLILPFPMFLIAGLKEKLFVLGLMITSLVYMVLPWSSLWWMMASGKSLNFLIMLLLIVWVGDTGAYFVGNMMGRHKLAPTLSPKKTWEGAVGGLLSSLLAGLTYSYFLMHHLWSSTGQFVFLMFFICITAVFAQAGDLFESLFKRAADQKDSGFLFPGHGGFLDRLDGVLFAAPIYAFLTMWIPAI